MPWSFECQLEIEKKHLESLQLMRSENHSVRSLQELEKDIAYSQKTIAEIEYAIEKRDARRTHG